MTQLNADPKKDPKTLTHDELRLELVRRLGWAANDDSAPKTDDALLQAYVDYDGYCLLSDHNEIDEIDTGKIEYTDQSEFKSDGEYAVAILIEWYKGLNDLQKLKLVMVLALAPGNSTL